MINKKTLRGYYIGALLYIKKVNLSTNFQPFFNYIYIGIQFKYTTTNQDF